MGPERSTVHTDLARQILGPIQRLREAGEPIVVTVDGGAELVVQDADASRQLLDELEEARAVEGIWQGLADREARRIMSLDDLREHFRRKQGPPV